MAGPNIKWTAGPGPAPLPYSKRAREALGINDDDKPWAHPDPPTLESWGLGGGGGGGGGESNDDALTEGRLRTNLLMIVLSIIVAIWVYRKFVKRDRTPFFYVPPTATDDANVSEEDVRTAREARLKRFEETKTSYADMMKEEAGGWTPGDDADSGTEVATAEASSEGLRHRGGNTGY